MECLKNKRGNMVLLLGLAVFVLLVSFVVFRRSGQVDNIVVDDDAQNVSDPKFGAVFVDIYLKGEADKQFDYQREKGDNFEGMVLDVIKTIDLDGADKEDVGTLMEEAIAADWRLSVSWNDPVEVETAGGQMVEPEYISFWEDSNGAYLLLNNPLDLEQQNEYFVSLDKQGVVLDLIEKVESKLKTVNIEE